MDIEGQGMVLFGGFRQHKPARDGEPWRGGERTVTEFDLLKARQRQLIEERHRERVLRFGVASSAESREVKARAPGRARQDADWAEDGEAG